MKGKSVLLLFVWFAVYITAMQFLRFRFGIFKISAACFVIGIILFWLFTGLNKPNSN
jgi:hypothetical protein